VPIKSGARPVFTNSEFFKYPYIHQTYSYYLNALLKYASEYTPQQLSNMNMRDFVLKYFTPIEFDHFIAQYGYSADLREPNAYVGMKLLYDDYTTKQYYAMNGGLNQLVDAMLADFKTQGGIYRDREAYESITNNSDGSFQLITSKKQADGSRRNIENRAHAIFFAASPTNLAKRPFSQFITEMNTHLYPMTLLRIYYIYNKPQDWLKGIDKVVTDTHIQFIIPISNRAIMISYTDSDNALYWNNLYETDKEKCIAELNMETEKVIGIRPTKPDHVQVEFWKNGVFLWKKGVNIADDAVYKRLLNPEAGIYVANEGYSRHQGWIEGAIEMAHDAVVEFRKTL
jgi:hypothetical protein